MKERIYGLDVMRAIAIAMVLVSHTLYIFQGYQNPMTYLLHVLGIQGVEVFFVLSGFLIGSILLKTLAKTRFSFSDVKRFWIRRWFRTLPLYFLMLLVNIGVALYVGYPLPKQLWRFFIFFQNFASEHILFFPESWSLSVEEYAYIVAPLVLYVFNKCFAKTQKAFLYSTICLILIFIGTKYLFYINHLDVVNTLEFWNVNVKAVVIYRIDAIYYGFVLAYLHQNYAGFLKQWRYYLFALGCLMGALIYIVIPLLNITFESHPFYWNVIYLPVNSIAIGLFLPFFYYLKGTQKKLQHYIKKVSLYSYAMYLLHNTFVLYIMRLTYPFDGMHLYQKIIYAIVYLLITYGLASMIYRYFEKPVMDLRERY